MHRKSTENANLEKNSSGSPECPLGSSALHMLSGCQNHIISSIKTERNNVAGRMVIKAISNSPWGAGLVNTDIGSNVRLE
eukprot:1142953-Pelagomonas_calceolata.AAC.1